MEIDIYKLEDRYSSALKKLEQADISPENRKRIKQFDRFLDTKVSLARRTKYIRLLNTVAGLLRIDFDKAEKKDIEDLVYRIDKNAKWSDETKRDYRVFIKRFYKWLLSEDDDEYPKLVKWIKTTGKRILSVKPSELLTKEEMYKILSISTHVRDKAFLYVLFESGCRIGEIATLRRKDIHFDQYGCLLNVKGKTGERPIRLVHSTSDIDFWYKHHPNKNPEAPMWCYLNNSEKALSYAALRKIIHNHFKLADIKKRCNPHVFRHRVLTNLSKHLSDQELKIYAGWSRNSNMIEVYSHLTGGDVAKKILQINNIETKEAEVEDKPVLCPRCHAPNSRDAEFCYNCNQVLKEEIAQRIQKTEDEKSKKITAVWNAWTSDPEIYALMKRKMEEVEKKEEQKTQKRRRKKKHKKVDEKL